MSSHLGLSSSKKINRRIDIGLRFNPNVDAKTISQITTGKDTNKFGLAGKELIKLIKVRYDDEWKKINLINTSIKLNIEINLDSKNILLAEKIEKVLSEIELIEKYYINHFNNQIISYTILSNSTPDKLKIEFEKFNIKVAIENNIWNLSE